MPWNQNLSDFDSSATTEEEQQTPETTPRAWWLTAKERTVYRRASSPAGTFTVYVPMLIVGMARLRRGGRVSARLSN